MDANTIFWMFIGFYATVKGALFVAIYLVTKAIERRALKEKEKRLTHNRLVELNLLVEEYENRILANRKDQEIYGLRHKRFIA